MSTMMMQGSGTTDDTRWHAVEARDARADGSFVYAVTTTGVFCRPSCPSRRALRRNVRYFASNADAAAAGFRACLRCCPDRPEDPSLSMIARVRLHLESNVDRAVPLEELGRLTGLSPHHLQRTFKRVVGVSPKQYVAALRADLLKHHLRAGATVSRATYEAGYGASSRAYAGATPRLGMSLAAYRRGGQGVAIRYAIAPTTLGWVLVGATARGLCTVTLGDDPESLERAICQEYPKADLRRVDRSADHDVDAWLSDVAAQIDGEPRPAVPIDAEGTAFQQRVWSELRRIPRGETRTYSQVAAAIGAPSAVRAVASACARNRVAIVIPCHRVVRQGGELGGYRWGLERKRRLLEAER